MSGGPWEEFSMLSRNGSGIRWEVGTCELLPNGPDDSWNIPSMNESMYICPIKNVRFRYQPCEFSGKLT